jgi:formamidopyrimidine-DNA glycosylase
VPELPEVEVVRRGLERWAGGRTVESAEVLHPRAIRRHPAGPGDFAARLTGRLLLPPRRRGKYLWIPLGDPSPAALLRPAGEGSPDRAEAGEALLAHLGMSGQLLVGEAGRPFEKHLRVRITFTNGRLDLRFVDQRTFGHLMIDDLVDDVFGGTAHTPGGKAPSRTGTAHGTAGGTGIPADTASGAICAAPAPDNPVPAPESPVPAPDSPVPAPDNLLSTPDSLVPAAVGAVAVSAADHTVPRAIAHIAPDPLEDAFDEETFFQSLRRRRTGIKRALLDQSLISGLGNIYADEALWRSRLHWARPTETMTRAEAARVLTAAREVMAAALNVGGTSFDSLYVNVNGESGYFDRSLNAYGRRDEPCGRCGTPIRRDVFMNRSSYSCPSCQPRPRRPRL